MKIAREKLCLYSSPVAGRSSSREIIEYAARYSLGGVELMNFSDELGEPSLPVARELRKMARGAGLALPCFSVGIDIISNTGSALERLFRYAEICSELEIPYLHHTIALDYRCGKLPYEEREQRFAKGAEAALELADFCAPLGVKTLIEDQGFVFNGVKYCDRLCRLSGERIGIVADVGNILFASESTEDFICAMGGRIRHVHLKDYEPSPDGEGYPTEGGGYIRDCEIGTGMLNFDTIGSAFDDVGYRGYYSIEFATVRGDDEVERVIGRLTV